MRSREGLTGTVSQRSQLLHLRLKVALQVPVRAFRRQIQEWLLRRVVVHDIYGAHLLLDFGHCGPLHTQALEGLAGWLVIAKPQHRFFSGTAMHASQGRGASVARTPSGDGSGEGIRGDARRLVVCHGNACVELCWTQHIICGVDCVTVHACACCVCAHSVCVETIASCPVREGTKMVQIDT